MVQDWEGILVSDGYGLYQTCVNRQTCLAHLIRKADALVERKKTDLRRFGEIVAAWLRQLVSFAKAPPDLKQWSDFYTFFLFTISLWEADKNDAGRLARQITREIDNLWVFLDHEGVDPTNTKPLNLTIEWSWKLLNRTPISYSRKNIHESVDYMIKDHINTAKIPRSA